MKYLCLIYQDETMREKKAKAELDKIFAEYAAFTDDIKRNGHFVGGNALQSTHTATMVRVRNGKVSTIDGPFAETKEQLGGFYLVEAKDRDEAVQLAARIPAVRWGSIEVRPIMEIE